MERHELVPGSGVVNCAAGEARTATSPASAAKRRAEREFSANAPLSSSRQAGGTPAAVARRLHRGRLLRYCSARAGSCGGWEMRLRLEQGSLVTVLGGSGFVGRHTVRALARDRWRVRAAVRRPDLAGHLQPMGDVGQIHAVQANLRYPDSVRRAVDGAEAVVNLVAVLSKSGPQTFNALHVVGARAAARAAREAGAKTFVHVSALGADRKSNSRYARSKAAGEAAVLEEFPDAIILRPSLVFGPEDQLFNRFAAMARFSPFLPL